MSKNVNSNIKFDILHFNDFHNVYAFFQRENGSETKFRLQLASLVFTFGI